MTQALGDTNTDDPVKKRYLLAATRIPEKKGGEVEDFDFEKAVATSGGAVDEKAVVKKLANYVLDELVLFRCPN